MNNEQAAIEQLWNFSCLQLPIGVYFVAPDGRFLACNQPIRQILDLPLEGPVEASIADFYADLLQPLNERQRKGLISRLSVGYFEGWHPTRQEMAQLVAQELRRSHPRR